MDDGTRLIEQALLRFALPLWMLAGFADWACHRVQRIEHSAGLKESWLHISMLMEIGTGIVAALAFQPTAALFVILILACAAHELTTWWDLTYANSRRIVPVYEQWIHGVQQTMPWVCLAGLMLAHGDQALTLASLGEATADWRLRPRDPALPAGAWVAVICSAAVLVVLPLLQEHWRCRRARSAQAGLATIR